MAMRQHNSRYSKLAELRQPKKETNELARRRYQKGSVIFNERQQIWQARYRQDVIREDGTVVRTRPRVILGTKRELSSRRLALRKLDELLARINHSDYQPTRTATLAEFATRWTKEVLEKGKPSSVRSAKSHLNSHIIPHLGKLRLDGIGPENQQVFVNNLRGASRKTVLNILSTLSSMLTTAKRWHYAASHIDVSELVLPERNDDYVAPHFDRSQVEAILALAQEPWRTFFVLLALTGMRAGEALGLQWPDIDFDHKCIHIRRSAWCGKLQSTKSKASAAPITLPDALTSVLRAYPKEWKSNAQGFLFTTRNGRPPSSNKVVEYRLWPILDALNIPRCGLHAFRHSVASFIGDAGFSVEVAQKQLRHSSAKTTQQYMHLRNDVTSDAMNQVAEALKVGPSWTKNPGGSKYLQ